MISHDEKEVEKACNNKENQQWQQAKVAEYEEHDEKELFVNNYNAAESDMDFSCIIFPETGKGHFQGDQQTEKL